MNIPVNKRKQRVPGTKETPMSSNLPNLSGSVGAQDPSTLSNSTANEQWNEAYRQLFDRY